MKPVLLWSDVPEADRMTAEDFSAYRRKDGSVPQWVPKWVRRLTEVGCEAAVPMFAGSRKYHPCMHTPNVGKFCRRHARNGAETPWTNVPGGWVDSRGKSWSSNPRNSRPTRQQVEACYEHAAECPRSDVFKACCRCTCGVVTYRPHPSQRIAELRAENERLRARLAELTT